MAWAELLANAAFDAAIVTAAVSVAGWFGTRIHAALAQRTESKEKRRIAIVRFYTDVRLRAEGLVGSFAPETVKGLEDAIRKHEAQGQPFRMYGTQVSDSRSQEEINIYLHTFSSQDAYLIRKFILFDRLLVIEYEKLQSEAFEALTTERKIAAIQSCTKTATELKFIAEKVEATIEGWSELEQPLDARLASDRGSDERLDRTHGRASLSGEIWATSARLSTPPPPERTG